MAQGFAVTDAVQRDGSVAVAVAIMGQRGAAFLADGGCVLLQHGILLLRLLRRGNAGLYHLRDL